MWFGAIGDNFIGEQTCGNGSFTYLFSCVVFSVGPSTRSQGGTLPVTLLTGHSFITWLQRYLNSHYRGVQPNKVLNVTQLTEVKLRGYPGEVTYGFLSNRMKTLPKADVVVLDIGCNDIDSREKYSDPKVAADYAAEIVKLFLNELGAKYVMVCNATLRMPHWRTRFVDKNKVNENIKLFNVHLENKIKKIARAETHEHSEMLKLSDSEWTKDGLHPHGLGMVRYVQSMRRAVIKAHKMLTKKI